eukprot:UN07660
MKGSVRSICKRGKIHEILMQPKVLMELHEAVESISQLYKANADPNSDICIPILKEQTSGDSDIADYEGSGEEGYLVYVSTPSKRANTAINQQT